MSGRVAASVGPTLTGTAFGKHGTIFRLPCSSVSDVASVHAWPSRPRFFPYPCSGRGTGVTATGPKDRTPREAPVARRQPGQPVRFGRRRIDARGTADIGADPAP